MLVAFRTVRWANARPKKFGAPSGSDGKIAMSAKQLLFHSTAREKILRGEATLADIPDQNHAPEPSGLPAM